MKHIYVLIGFILFWGVNSNTWGQTFNPTRGQIEVSTSPILTIDFGQNVTLADSKSITVSKHDGTGKITMNTGLSFIPGSRDSRLSVSGNILTINLSAETLDSNTEYSVSSVTGAIKVGGSDWNNLVDDTYWRFTTIASQVIFSPSRGATNTSLSPYLSISFPAQASIAFGTYIYVISSDYSHVTQLFTGNSLADRDQRLSTVENILTIDLHNQTLNGSTEYFVYCTDGTISVGGTAWNELSDNTYWRFTTAPPIEITNYSPTPDAINVAVSPILQLTFNQDVRFITPESEYKILLRQGGSTIDEFIVSPGFTDGALKFDAVNHTTDRLTITPYSILDINTQYHVIIPNGLIESVNGDLFTGITSSTGWRFTTVGKPIWTATYPKTENLTPTQVDVVGQTDKAGSYYYVVSSSSTAPTVAQIKAGQDHTGFATNFIAGSGAMNASTDFRIAVDISNHTLYQAETPYYVHLVATDNVNSLDSDVGSTLFTTLERTAPIASFNPTSGSTNVSTINPVIITFNEPIRNISGTDLDDISIDGLIQFACPSQPDPSVQFDATIDATKTIVTVTPQSILNENTGYSVTISQVEDYLGNEQVNPSTTTFQTAQILAWNGMHSADWTYADNWDGTFAPGSSVHVSASANHMPIISSDITVGDISIEAGASVEIINTGSLTINGSLTMGSSTTGAGNATLLDNGSTPVSVDPSRVSIQQAIMAGDRTYHFSAPTSGATKTNMGVTNAIMAYDNPTDSWNLMGDNDPLTAGIGYILRSSSNVVFSGQLNSNASYTTTLVRTNGKGYGWNLVGNPYTAAIDWNAIDAIIPDNKLQIHDVYYIFLNDAANYGTFASYSSVGGGTHGLTNEIPTHQGFFVKVLTDSPSGSLTIPKTALISNSKSILKSTEKSVNYPKIKLAGINGDYTDETIIAFADIANNQMDKFDASKRISRNKNYIQLYTLDESESYAINCKNDIQDGLVIPLGFNVAKTGVFKIKKQSSDGILNNYDVLLEDKYNEGTLINLSEQASYEFTTELTGYVNDRFALHFIEHVSTNINTPKTETTLIYGDQNNVCIHGKQLSGKKYEIYTLSGTIIKNGVLQNNGLNTIGLNYSGLIIVKVSTDSGDLSKKVLLK